MAAITYRQPTPSDAVAMTRLVRQSAVLDENSHYLYLLLCDHFRETCVIAERDGAFAGFLTGYRPPTHPEAVFVWQVVVAEQARGQGVAGGLLEELLAREACADVSYLEATVTPSNEPSQRLFRSLARRHETQCQETELFSTEMFRGIDDSHEPEILFRIGPLNRLRAAVTT